jgi:hypothetical protein
MVNAQQTRGLGHRSMTNLIGERTGQTRNSVIGALLASGETLTQTRGLGTSKAQNTTSVQNMSKMARCRSNGVDTHIESAGFLRLKTKCHELVSSFDILFSRFTF